MGLLEYTELVLGVLLLGMVFALGYIWLRRHVIADGKPLLLCALRTPAEPMWRLGLLRIGSRQLDWYSMIGPSLRPGHTWERMELEIDAPIRNLEAIPALGESLTAAARHAGVPFDMAMPASGHTAIRAWLESQPPGVEGYPQGQFT